MGHWPPEGKHCRALEAGNTHRHSKRRDYHPDSAPSGPSSVHGAGMDVRDGAQQLYIGRARIVPSDFTDSAVVVSGLAR